MNFSCPQVMGIVNLTPDSFYEGSRTFDSATADSLARNDGSNGVANIGLPLNDGSIASLLAERVRGMVRDGAAIIDVGAFSTRPGAADVSPDEEYRRLAWGLPIVKQNAGSCLVSVDTFRADVARRVVTEFGVDIINDIGGGTLDAQMFRAVADLGVAYVLMHMRGTPQTMQQHTEYNDIYTEVLDFLARRVDALRAAGVENIIVDPGYGFAKTLEQNYELFARQGDLVAALDCPLLVGVSRKSMIYRLLDTSADAALNGTIVLNTIALMQGASILRVHDVRPAVEAVRIVGQLRRQT